MKVIRIQQHHQAISSPRYRTFMALHPSRGGSNLPQFLGVDKKGNSRAIFLYDGKYPYLVELSIDIELVAQMYLISLQQYNNNCIQIFILGRDKGP